MSGIAASNAACVGESSESCKHVPCRNVPLTNSDGYWSPPPEQELGTGCQGQNCLEKRNDVVLKRGYDERFSEDSDALKAELLSKWHPWLACLVKKSWCAPQAGGMLLACNLGAVAEHSELAV